MSPGQIVQVDRLAVAEGSQVELDKVLLLVDGDKVRIGKPLIEGANVVAEALGEKRGKKIIVFKYKSKARYRRKKGHHQIYTRLAIKDINWGEAS